MRGNLGLGEKVVGRSGCPRKLFDVIRVSRRGESNPQPPHYECGALPIEATPAKFLESLNLQFLGRSHNGCETRESSQFLVETGPPRAV